MVSTWEKFDGHSIYNAKVSPIYIVLWECIVVIYTQTTFFTNILTGHCMSDHRILFMYKISDLYLLRFLRYWDSH